MKIVIPVDDTQKEVCVSFGRAPYFLVCDTEADTTELLDNPAAEAAGGAGLMASQFVVDSGATVLVTVRCGQNAADVLKEAGIAIYKSEGPSAEENLKAMKEQKLAELTHFHAGFHGRA